MNWKNAANYVCKQYIDEVSRDVYFDDARLQMDAKLWGEEYNRYNPPKKVCSYYFKSYSHVVVYIYYSSVIKNFSSNIILFWVV